MVLRGNAGGGVFISVLQGDHRKLTTEEGDDYRAQSGGGPHGFQGERRGLFVSVLQGDSRKLTTEEGNH